jgi:hypothetical protein
LSWSGQVGQAVGNTLLGRCAVAPEIIIADAGSQPNIVGIHRVGVTKALLYALIELALAGFLALALDQ